MGIKRVIVAACAVATLVGVPHAARAADAAPLHCGFEVHLAFSPGISPQLEEIRITSTQPGPLSCTGTWSGREVAGQGLVTFEGDALGTCAGSTIDAIVRMDHPLADGGRFHIAVPVRSGRVGAVLYGTSDDPARPASLLGTGTPDPGQNCVTTPITGIAAQGRVIVGPEATPRVAS